MYTALPEMALRPADAYDRFVHGRVESVEIDKLMGRILAVMVVPYPPGIPLIMPGERLTQQQSRSRITSFTRGISTEVSGLRDRYSRPALRAGTGGRRYLVDCLTESAR